MTTTMWLRISAIAGGGFLLIQAARKRSFERVALTGIAAALIGTGILLRSTSQQEQDEEQPEDIVDLASELSFPASDPPAY